MCSSDLSLIFYILSRKDLFTQLLYADGDVLYLPVEKIDKITKFTGREGAIVRLDKLGTDSWNKKKARVRSKLENIAGDLIRVSAERENSKGFAFSPDDEEQILFESKFKYTATADQERAIGIIKHEMEKDKPMDMLLCGEIEVPVKMLVTRARTERPHGALLQFGTGVRQYMYRIGGRL